MPRTYTLTRVDTLHGKEITWRGLKVRDMGQMVAYCAADNLGLPRQTAARYGMLAEKALRAGESFGLTGYEFRAEAEVQ